MVDECFNCGISGERVRLFDAISGKGIVKICKECLSRENIPIIEKPSEIFTRPPLYSDLNGKRKTVYERLSSISGIKTEEKRNFKSIELKQRETTLRDIVDKNFKIQIKEEIKPRFDLVDNFHWIIMRVRRSKHITQEQLAKAISEPEAAIKIAERGALPEDSYKFINKLENYLGIKLIKKEFAEKIKEKSKEISFDSVTTKNLTIADLKQMKRKRESAILGEKIKEDENSEENLSQEEIDDLVFEKDNHNL